MFEILEQPADIGFRAFGGMLAELFANAADEVVGWRQELAAAEESKRQFEIDLPDFFRQSQAITCDAEALK
jgi:SHS2 domain-containing protein